MRPLRPLNGCGEEENYFVRRMHASSALARSAADSVARLIHFELAGRYSIAAVAAGRGMSLEPGASEYWGN